MRRKKREQEASASGDRRLTPVDVQQVEFRLAFRGYNERDVDAFLDRVTEDMASYLDEIGGLRAAPGAAPAMQGVAMTEARAEADAIVARAREEAAHILRRAEADAAAIRAAAGSSGTGDARGAVAPFLNREREFLQAIGTLVQEHAEEIKQMVLALRGRRDLPPAPVSPSPAPVAATEPQPTPTHADAEIGAGDGSTASASEMAERYGMSPTSLPGAPVQAEEGEEEETETEEPVVIESTEPAYSSEGAAAGERRERSLRELFWGEE